MRDETKHPGIVMTGAGMTLDVEELEAQLDECGDKSYDSLHDTLMEAYTQASAGKGKERHSRDADFSDQIICQIERLDVGFNRGQAIKKIAESRVLEKIKGTEAAVHELLGAINYLAAKIITLKEQVRDQEENERKESD